MSLNDFYVDMRGDLDAFLEEWKAMSQQEPRSYPWDMEPGDWFDQFMAFLSLRGKE